MWQLEDPRPEEDSNFLVSEMRSDLWSLVDAKYFAPATWEKTVNDYLGYHSYGRFIQLMMARLGGSNQDLREEAVALGKLITNENNRRFYSKARRYLPDLKPE